MLQNRSWGKPGHPALTWIVSTLTQGFYSHSLVSQGICIDNFLALVFLGALVDTSTTLNNRSLVTTILLPHYTSPVWKIATKPEILQEFTTTHLGLTNTIVFQYDKHLPVCLTRSDVCDRFLWETDQYHKVQSVLYMRSGNRTKLEQQSHFTNSSWERVSTETKVIHS